MATFDFVKAVEQANKEYFSKAGVDIVGRSGNNPAGSAHSGTIPTSGPNSKAADAYVVDFGDLPPISRSCVSSAAPISEGEQLAQDLAGSELWFNLTEPSSIDMGQELIYRDRDGTMRVRRDGDSSD
jgi:hypothetical protein